MLLTVSAFAQERTYLGFDRNDYPGDAAMKRLIRDFSFTGYWLNRPPGSSGNSWKGKRRKLEELGFGFLVVFNGRLFAQITGNATALGISDGQAAIASARLKGFPAHTIIFLDQEQGGRLLPEQRSYLYAWIDTVRAAGFGAGVYCSGIAFREDSKTTVITAEDIRQNAGPRDLTYWVSNDACPPSPGCTLGPKRPEPSASGLRFADIWQFAQSPRRKDFAYGCGNYSPDGNCYRPGLELEGLHLDLDAATSADPSRARN
ncbi:MAG: DUF1906 domain-containing protein [Acidobacteriales bacterium]|nr:DUF1906 domain-containing protein [Terriglobales bacterium]